jgi:hypothetical protein
VHAFVDARDGRMAQFQLGDGGGLVEAARAATVTIVLAP